MEESKEIGFFKYLFKVNLFLLPALLSVNIIAGYLAIHDIKETGLMANWAYSFLPIIDILVMIWLIFDWKIQGKGKNL